MVARSMPAWPFASAVKAVKTYSRAQADSAHHQPDAVLHQQFVQMEPGMQCCAVKQLGALHSNLLNKDWPGLLTSPSFTTLGYPASHPPDCGNAPQTADLFF